MILKAIFYIFLIAIVLIALSVIAVVLLAYRRERNRSWIWKTSTNVALCIVALAVVADACVLVGAVWNTDSQQAVVYTTPESMYDITTNAAPTNKVAEAPQDTASTAKLSGDNGLIIKVSICEFEDEVSTTGSCNLRSYPSTNGEKLAHLDEGETLTRLGFNADGWSKVVYNGVEGYIASEYLQSVDRDDNEIVLYSDTARVTESGPLYAQPDWDSTEVLYVTASMTLTRTGITPSGWSQVEYEGSVYYIRSSLLAGE